MPILTSSTPVASNPISFNKMYTYPNPNPNPNSNPNPNPYQTLILILTQSLILNGTFTFNVVR